MGSSKRDGPSRFNEPADEEGDGADPSPSCRFSLFIIAGEIAFRRHAIVTCPA